MSTPRKSSTQANDVTYELHSLGWKAFQDLCSTITSEIWGQTIQSFFSGKDGGRDGAFHGVWKPKAGEVFAGAFTTQCKFTAKRDKRIRLADLKDEMVKAKSLAARGLAANYILMTNASLTAEAEAEMKRAFESIPGIKCFAGYGGEWISRVIRESSRLRMLVPRIYGLGDLSQILDERAYAQAREILSALGDDLAKFVITDAFRQSAKAVVEHGFVLLLGEPASGKSTIAAALAVGAADVWGCSTVKVRDADDFVTHWNPNDPNQFFWVDDAFGATQFDWATAAGWNRAWSHMHAAVRKGARVLFTSRDYIYRSARQHLKESAFPLVRESQVVIYVEKLTKEEKEQILYNHIRLGTQPVEFRQKIKPFLPTIAANKHFLPEIARRLGSPFFTKNLAVVETALNEFAEKPLELLKEVIRTMDNAGRAALALVFMRAGNLASPISLEPAEEKAVALLGGNVASVREALKALDESLILQVIDDNRNWWRFKHPTVRDAFGSLVADDRELLDIYLLGTPVETLVQEITCGDVGMQGVKVIVPNDRFDLVIRRMEELKTSGWDNHITRNRFLASRCEKGFLQHYLEKHPGFIGKLPVWSHLDAISEAPLFSTLYRYGLLPEDERRQFVKEARELAIDTPDAGFLRESLRLLFTPEELQETLALVRSELLPKLEDVIWSWRSNFRGQDSSPDGYFGSLEQELERFKDEFEGDSDAVVKIDEALKMIEEMINDLSAEEGDSGSRGDSEWRPGTSFGSSERSIFDDVDE
jgi:hypothetical protein